MRLGRQTAIHFAARIIISVSGFVATFVIARFLGADVLGKYAVVVALGYFWLVLPSNAINAALTKRISEGVDRGAYLTAGFAINGVLALCLAGLILLASGPISRYVGAPVSEYVALLTVSSVAFTTVIAALYGQKKVGSGGILKAVERGGRTVAQVALLLFGFEFAGLIVGQVASLFLTAVLGLFLFEVRPAKPGVRHVRSLSEYARYSWLGTLQSRMFGWMDTIVLAFFVTSSLIGIYEVAWGLASVLGMINSSIRETLFPEVSELAIDDEYERIHHYLSEAMTFCGIFVIPGLFGAAVLGDRVLRIYHPEFQAGHGILLILISSYIANVYASQFLSAINALNRPDIAFRVNLAFVVTNMALNVVLVMGYGWYGAAVATAMSAVIMLILSYRSLVSLIGQPQIPFIEIGREISAGLFMAVVVIPFEWFAPTGNYVTIGIVLFGAVVYVATLVTLSVRIRQKVRSILTEMTRPAAGSG